MADALSTLTALSSPQGPSTFPPGACDRLDAHQSTHLVGQALAVRQLADAVCDHAARLERAEVSTSARPPKPLVLSAHGPPGVGKTLAAALTAAALFAPPGRDPADPAWACPGWACPGYRVFFGMDFGGGERGGAQLAATRRALASHAAAHPAALIVVEEYDKLDCAARGLFRAMLAGNGGRSVSAGGGAGGWSAGGAGSPTNGSSSSSSSSPPAAFTSPMPDLSRAIVLLESNTGYAHLASALAAASADAVAAAAGGDEAAAAALASDGDGRALLPPETAARLLKDAVYASWAADGCEAPGDTVRAVAAVDWFLPFLPLHLSHVRALLARRLADRAARAEAEAGLRLVWDDGVLDFLADRVDVGEPLGLGLGLGGEASGSGAGSAALYPIEGAREVATLVTRYVTRAVREVQKGGLPPPPAAAGRPGAADVWRGVLVVSGDGRRLEVRLDRAAGR